MGTFRGAGGLVEQLYRSFWLNLQGLVDSTIPILPGLAPKRFKVGVANTLATPNPVLSWIGGQSGDGAVKIIRAPFGKTAASFGRHRRHAKDGLINWIEAALSALSSIC